ncbi:MAG: T9SS C-terminal target domain-containing protein [Candidatus Neomarinimicrobiota bacterium]|nr:MAG: T9SS C-terminal target domain-containing protein [Candidatus Neomarinimicrobiota bacterium]
MPHGAVIAPDGRIWVGYYAYTDTLGMPNDTIPIKPIYVYNPDGTQADFSPIQVLSWADGRQDTMWNGCRGVALDNNGNILYSAYNDIWQINYQTGEPMGALYDFGGSITEAAVTADGYMFVTRVVPGGDPIWVFDISLGLPSTPTVAADWTDGLVNTINDGTNNVISRSVLVTSGGTDLYHGKIYGGTHNNGVIHYHSADGPEGTWQVEDILYREVMWGQILDWGPDSTIWVGSYWDVDEGDFTGYYALDPGAHYQIVNSIGTGQPFGVPYGSAIAGGDTIRAPRGVAFTDDGQTAYVCDFDGGRVSKFVYSTVSVDEEPVANVPLEFQLHQNYPNPFNPTTKISFDLFKEGHVKLTVYDVLGREVAVLVDKVLPVGQHVVDFDAHGLSSGMYIYTLQTDHKLVSKRMTLLK